MKVAVVVTNFMLRLTTMIRQRQLPIMEVAGAWAQPKASGSHHTSIDVGMGGEQVIRDDVRSREQRKVQAIPFGGADRGSDDSAAPVD